MKLKTLAVAMALGATSLAANALTVTSLDAISGPLTWKLAGVTTEYNTQAGTTETTWGLGRITEISSSGGPGSTDQIWQSATSDGTYLYYMLYGIADLNIADDGAGGFKIYNDGATGGSGADGKIHLDLYRTTTVITPILNNTANPLTRSGYSSDTLLAGLGPAYLTVEFAIGKQLLNRPALPLCDGTNGTPSPSNPGGDGSACMTNPTADETLASLIQNTDGAQLPASGDGNFFADATGGTAMTKWDTNGLFGHDFDGHFTLIPNEDTYGGACSAAQLASNECFTGNVNDPIRSRALPEPGSLALLGGALFGLAALRRRKTGLK